MRDWMISKKRYWGLALPIWVCEDCEHFDVIGSREELKERAIEGWDEFDGHTPHRPWVDAVKITLREVRRHGAPRPRRGQPLARRRHRALLHRATTTPTATTGRSGSRPTWSSSASPASSATGSTRCWP